MAVFGLSFSDSELLVYQAGLMGPTMARVDLPRGLVRAGRITNPSQLAERLAAAKAGGQPRAIGGPDVVVALPEEQAFLKIVHLPAGLTKSELRSTIEYQWDAILPVARTLVDYDVRYLPNRSPKGPRPVLVVAYPQEIIAAVVVAVHQLGLVPTVILPRSFGLARLFSAHRHTSSLLLDSDSGERVSAIIAQDGLALFSTTVHASVDAPKLVRQVGSLVGFWRREDEISRIDLLPGPYVGNLAQTLASVGLPIATPNLEGSNETERWPYAALLGLLSGRFDLSVISPALTLARTARWQIAVTRLAIISFSSFCVLAAYLSLVFFLSLEINIRSKIAFSSTIIERVHTDAQATAQRVAETNQLIARLNGAKSSMSRLVLAGLIERAATTGVTLVSLDYQAGQTARVDLTAPAAEAITAYIAGVKQLTGVTGVTIDKTGTTTAGTTTAGTTARVTFTLGAAA